MHDLLAGDQVGRNGKESLGQLLDQRVAHDVRPEPLDALALDEGDRGMV